MINFKNKPLIIESFKGKEIAVVGEGVEGRSSTRFLKEYGARVTVLDQKQGKDYLKELNKYDLVVRSPGVKIQNLEGRIQNERITSQTKLFFDLCPCPIIGITGTKGKGTTASLIYEMLEKEGKDVYLGGNIGEPPLNFLNKLNTRSIVVLELSSFQLIDLTKSPHIAVVLMTTSEHLDYHKDVAEYVWAKRNILRFQKDNDFAIVNKDYPASNESDIHTKAKVFKVSREMEVEEGCFVKDREIVVKLSVPGYRLSDKTRSVFSSPVLVSRKQISKNLKSENIEQTTEIIDVKDILLPGRHNLENVCAAVMVSVLCGVSKKNISQVLKTFKGLEHRLELVRTVNGVKYYDDSFSTTPETAMVAIEAFDSPKILVLGGSGKKSDFKELGEVISSSNNIKAIIGIGLEWPRIKSKIKNQKSKIRIYEGCKNMKEIVQTASKISKPGDVVLLSPACASFDMFKNYKDRGNQFKREVKKLSIN